MNRSSVNWHGPMPAVVTPFDERGAIDASALRDNLVRLIDNGATGFIVGGCTGEFWAMSQEERIELFRLAARAVAGRATVIVGTSAIRQDEVMHLNKAAADAGCDGALILPPHFVALTDDEIFAHFEAISERAALPIMLYNIPQCATNAITPALALRISTLDQVVAIKESAGNWRNFHAILMAVRDKLRVFCGPSSVYGVPAVAAGADGIIDCFPNVWAPGGLDLYHAAVAGDDMRARQLQEMGLRLTELFTSEGRSLYPATKAGMEILGVRAGKPRLPLKPLSQEQYDGLRRGMAALGLI